MVVIREFKRKDGEPLKKIYAEAFRDEIEKGMESLTAENFVNFSKRPQATIFVGEENGIAVGHIAISLRKGLPTQIHAVAVKAQFRRQGVGKRLIEEAMKCAKSAGKKKIILRTRPWNKAMRKVCLDRDFIPEAYLRKELREEDLIRYTLFL